MNLSLAQITLLVEDYDKAIAYYTQKLNFTLLEDTPLAGAKRWVRVAADPHGGPAFLLAKAEGESQRNRVGNQTGGRVSFFLYSSDFQMAYKEMLAKGVSFTQAPREEPYGTVAVFKDLYGNLWDLIQPGAGVSGD